MEVTLETLEEEIDNIYEDNEYTFTEEQSMKIRERVDDYVATLDDWLSDEGTLPSYSFI